MKMSINCIKGVWPLYQNLLTLPKTHKSIYLACTILQKVVKPYLLDMKISLSMRRHPTLWKSFQWADFATEVAVIRYEIYLTVLKKLFCVQKILNLLKCADNSTNTIFFNKPVTDTNSHSQRPSLWYLPHYAQSFWSTEGRKT